VNSDEFESKVLELWMKSRVPLTQANLQYFAGVPRREMDRWIDKLLASGVLDIDEAADEAGDLAYVVPGAQRSLDGPTTPEKYEAKRKLVEEAKQRILARRAGKPIPESRELEPADSISDDSREDEDEDEEDDGSGVASAVAKAALFTGGKALVALDKPLAMLDKPRGKGEKSLAASAALSLLGPVGWLYAGSFREAIPATLAAAAAYYVVPSFIMAPFLLVGALASSAVGLTYAWQFNRKKGRTPLFLSDKSKKKNKKNEE
jgi:hypothetical protein